MGVTSCGPPPGVTVSAGTDSPFYEKNDTITISGILYSVNDGKIIPIQILNPLNNTVGRYNVTVDSNNKFSLQVKADFNTTGVYHMLTCFHDWCDNAYFKYVAEPYKLSFNGSDYLIKYKSFADLVGIEVRH